QRFLRDIPTPALEHATSALGVRFPGAGTPFSTRQAMNHPGRLVSSGLCMALLLITWDPGRSHGRDRPKMPALTRPVMFNTPEAHKVLAALQVCPADNPRNEDISKLPVHPSSANIIASIGANKSLAFNPDMSFILVPPGQKKVPVKITAYPGESA